MGLSFYTFVVVGMLSSLIVDQGDAWLRSKKSFVNATLPRDARKTTTTTSTTTPSSSASSPSKLSVIRDRPWHELPRDVVVTTTPAPESACDTKVVNGILQMKYEDVTRIYSSFFKSAKDLNITGCQSRPVCIMKVFQGQETRCIESRNIYSCKTLISGGSPCPGGTSDGGKCCETCRTELDLVTETFTHPVYGTVYPVQFPSLDLFQPSSIGFCGRKQCERCEEVYGMHTFLVSPSPVPDPPTPGLSLSLIFHTENLPMYCRCTEK